MRRRAARSTWTFYLLLLVSVALMIGGAAAAYYYVTLSRLIDARLQGGLDRAIPRVFARPLTLRAGQLLTLAELVNRLNDLGYSRRAAAELPGEFAVARDTVTLIPTSGGARSRRVRVSLSPRTLRGDATPARIRRIEVAGDGTPADVTLESPLLTALATRGREKRRDVPLARMPRRLVEAVLAIEDRRFYDHPGVDPLRIAAAMLTNLRSDRRYLVGASTLTQQLVKNTFLTPEKTLRRKLREQLLAVMLERRLSKDRILELYLNDVYLGHRNSFAIHGVAEAARLFFSKDVANLSLGEAATIAGVIQSPQSYSPFTNVSRARERRNVVLAAMAEARFIPAQASARTARDPLVVAARGLDAEAPYFVDLVSQEFSRDHSVLFQSSDPIDIYTTLDLHLQRLAQEAIRDGLNTVDALLAARPGPIRKPEAALIALDPQTGQILALVGGRSYSASQFNRATLARRQPGSVFKPFVYLAAFERAAAEGLTDLTPATIVDDSPTEFAIDQRRWQPANYGNEYDGPITLRRALAFSRNVPAVKIAERAGYATVASLWRRMGAETVPRAYPSIALGVFEATPLEIAAAYSVFSSGGQLRTPRTILRIQQGSRQIRPRVPAPRRVARADTTFLVTHMMRSVLDDGTGAAARAAGFRLDAAGKSGTTNDLRDAWFVGFTPELLSIVWVGLDDNRPLRLSGTQAALPIWTSFMTRALAGQPDRPFEAPDGIQFVEIDPDTGLIATAGCLKRLREAFLAGTGPGAVCAEHRLRPAVHAEPPD